MSINISSLFSDGLEDSKKNPIIFVPNAVASIGLSIISTIMAVFLFIFIALISYTSSAIGAICLMIAVIVFYVIILILCAYLIAGLTGMSFEAVKKGTTEISSFFSYGNKYVLRILASIILIGLIAGIPIGLVFGLISILAVASPTIGIILMLFSFLLICVYALVLFIYLYFVTYAIVIDDLPVIESIRKSIALFNANKSDVLTFLAYMLLVYLAIGFVFFILSLLSLIPLLGLIFSLISFVLSFVVTICLTPYLTVVGTRMYLELTQEKCCCSGGCLTGEYTENSENETESNDVTSEQNADDIDSEQNTDADESESSESDEK